MILNHASVAPAGWQAALGHLPEMARGMAELVEDGVAERWLRLARSPFDIRLDGERSLFDAILELRSRGGRDEAVFLLGLTQKAPLVSGLAPEITDRFRRCETKALPPDDGGPLVLCCVADAIAVGFPSETVWDCDRLRVELWELLPDGTLGEASEEIDNLTRAEHAGRIAARFRERLRRRCSDAADLWERRGLIFPDLGFGPDVEEHLAEVNPGWLPTLVNRLAELDETAAAWKTRGGDAPRWRCKVTPESPSLREYQGGKFLDARRFRAASGERVLFEWHARFGSGARIHLRFDSGRREIEIGYVGDHLPMPPRQ